MNTFLQEKLRDVVQTCLLHQQRIEDAFQTMSQWDKVNQEIYHSLSKEQIAITDQYVYRFAKLQDLMGDKLFRLALEFVGENIERTTFLDQLNKLEKLGAIESVELWFDLRNERNRIAHDYVKSLDEILEDLCVLLDKKDVLIRQLHLCLEFLQLHGFAVI